MKNIGNSASSGSGADEAQIAATNSASGSASNACSESTAKPAARAAVSISSIAAPVSSCAQRSRSGRHRRSACAAWRTTMTVSTRDGVATSAEAMAVRIRLASAEPMPDCASSARPTPRITSDRSSVISAAVAARAPARIASLCAGARPSVRSAPATASTATSAAT